MPLKVMGDQAECDLDSAQLALFRDDLLRCESSPRTEEERR
jgi:hypothetical protein